MLERETRSEIRKRGKSVACKALNFYTSHFVKGERRCRVNYFPISRAFESRMILEIDRRNRETVARESVSRFRSRRDVARFHDFCRHLISHPRDLRVTRYWLRMKKLLRNAARLGPTAFYEQPPFSANSA